MKPADYTPTTNPKVLAKLEKWFHSQPEILVRVRRPRSGSEEFQFFSSLEALAERMRDSVPYTWFTVFEKPQLSLRGVVDDAFIERCLASIPDRSEYLIAETSPRVAGKRSWFHNLSSDAKAEMRDDLETSRGAHVAVGLYPPTLEDRDDVIHAFTPDVDGKVKPGPY